MILKASQRGGAKALALHLLNADDNEHIDVHAIKGFMANDVVGALQEIEAISRATSCKQPMFSLSLSPPKDAVVSTQDFENAVEEAMQRNGLDGQPHVVIFHEKHGRRHAHVVVSRIDADRMKAINLSFFNERLMELSRELFVTHGWDMPKGHEDRTLSDPLNYSLEEYQVAKRAKRDPQEVKARLHSAWEQSDGKASFSAALWDVGFALARGDRRGFVAVDAEGNIYSLSRWLGTKTKDLKMRLGDPSEFHSVEGALVLLQPSRPQPAKEEIASQVAALDAQIERLTSEKSATIAEHRSARADLMAAHEAEAHELIKGFTRSQRSLRGMFHWLSGQRPQIVATHKAALAELRHQHDLAELALSSKQCVE